MKVVLVMMSLMLCLFNILNIYIDLSFKYERKFKKESKKEIIDKIV